jgi:hypothetical protein
MGEKDKEGMTFWELLVINILEVIKMTEATLRIPGNIDIRKVSEEIVYKAFAIAIEKKRKEIQRELRRVDSKIKRFERKYKMEFEEYEKLMPDSFQNHNDWMDWSFLMENKKQLERQNCPAPSFEN